VVTGAVVAGLVVGLVVGLAAAVTGGATVGASAVLPSDVPSDVWGALSVSMAGAFASWLSSCVRDDVSSASSPADVGAGRVVGVAGMRVSAAPTMSVSGLPELELLESGLPASELLESGLASLEPGALSALLVAAVSGVALASGAGVVGGMTSGTTSGMLVKGGGIWQEARPSAVMAGIRRASRITGQTPGLRFMPGTLDQPMA